MTMSKPFEYELHLNRTQFFVQPYYKITNTKTSYNEITNIYCITTKYIDKNLRPLHKESKFRVTLTKVY